MKSSIRRGLVLATVLGAANLARAGDISFSGKIWSYYKVDMTSGAGYLNGFDVARAYFQAAYKFDDNWSTNWLVDHERYKTTAAIPATATAGAIPQAPWVFVKYAYIENKGLLGEGVMMRFGQQPTLYIGTIESAVKTRWIAKTIVDEAGTTIGQGTSDAGVRVSGSAANGMLNWAAAIHNGNEGVLKAGSSDNALAGSLALTLKPMGDGAMSGFGITVNDTIYAAGRSGTTVTASRNLLATAVHLTHDMLDGALEFFMSRTAGVNTVGFGGEVNVKPVENASLFVRFLTGNDSFKTAYGSNTLLTVGPTYSFMKDKITTALVYETKSQAAGSAKQSIVWTWAANF